MENIVFEGDADRVSSFNEIGRFDVLKMHANFISIIRQELTIYHRNDKVKELPLDQAVMKVKKDEVHIFLGVEAFVLDEESSATAELKKK
jgi:F0F1-type ATP synthase epsilon subunit